MAQSRARGGVGGAILTGVQTVLGQLAQFFRLGQFGAIPEGETPEPARPRLTTPEEIVQAAIDRHLTTEHAPPQRQSEQYVCVYTDADTGAVLARLLEIVESDIGTARSTRYSRARRQSAARLPRYLAGQDVSLLNVEVTCRKMRTPPVQF